MNKSFPMVLVAALLLPMCSKSSEPPPKETAAKAEPKTESAHKEIVVTEAGAVQTAPALNPSWAAQLEEIVKKAGALADLADTTRCEAAHNGMIDYLKVHQTRLEELATAVTKMNGSVPKKDKVAFEKKKAADYDHQMGGSIAKMARFAQLCCNKSLKQEDALALEAKLEFIRILQSGS